MRPSKVYRMFVTVRVMEQSMWFEDHQTTGYESKIIGQWSSIFTTTSAQHSMHAVAFGLSLVRMRHSRLTWVSCRRAAICATGRYAGDSKWDMVWNYCMHVGPPRNDRVTMDWWLSDIMLISVVSNNAHSHLVSYIYVLCAIQSTTRGACFYIARDLRKIQILCKSLHRIDHNSPLLIYVLTEYATGRSRVAHGSLTGRVDHGSITALA